MHSKFLRVVPFLVLISACTAPALDTGATTSSSSSSQGSSFSADSSSASSDFFDRTTHSGIYKNTEFGFSLTYPTHFEPIRVDERVFPKKYGAYIADGELKYKGEIMPLLNLKASDRDIDADFNMHIHAFPLKDYTKMDIYADEYAYDPDKDTWFGLMQQEPFAPESMLIGGKKAYLFGFGDAGWSSMTYVIPLPEKSVVLEIMLGGCMGCLRDHPWDGLSEDVQAYEANVAHMRKETDEILASIRFE